MHTHMHENLHTCSLSKDDYEREKFNPVGRISERSRKQSHRPSQHEKSESNLTPKPYTQIT
jgi:hypothetical protein